MSFAYGNVEVAISGVKFVGFRGPEVRRGNRDDDDNCHNCSCCSMRRLRGWVRGMRGDP